MIVLSFMLHPGAVPLGQAETIGPVQLRALYLYNFAKFTTWPENAFPTSDSLFILGILGEDPFTEEFLRIQHREKLDVQGQRRSLKVEHYKDLRDITRCQMLFIAASEKKALERIREELGNSTVLTVAEMEGGALDEVMINLILKNQKLTFAINKELAGKAGLKFDSRLLGLAAEVSQ